MENEECWGEVICDRVPWSRSISRFVDKQIQQWLRNKSGAAKAHYQVFFERVTQGGHCLGCHVKLELGDEVWTGSQYAGGLHQSLIMSLQHMACRERKRGRPRLVPALANTG
jgi:hypothetical protein